MIRKSGGVPLEVSLEPVPQNTTIAWGCWGFRPSKVIAGLRLSFGLRSQPQSLKSEPIASEGWHDVSLQVLST